MLMEHLLSVVRGIYTSPLNLILVSGFVLAEWWVPTQ
jgi:hypothetical protein